MVQNNNVLKTILAVIGGILAFAGFFWARAGFYVRDLPVMLTLIVAGCVCLFISAKIKVNKNKGAGVPLSDKWKCSCGSYNNRTDPVCWNCGKRNVAPQPTVNNNYPPQSFTGNSNSSPQKWKCNCGTYNNGENSFCSNCGQRK
jgi:hypothetical protein